MRTLLRLVLFIPLVLLAVLPRIALAQDTPPTPEPQTPQDLVLFTRFPSQEAAVGDDVTFPLTLRAPDAQVVRLTAESMPNDWTASFRGDGKSVQSAYVLPGEDTNVNLQVTPPRYAQAGSYSFSIVANGENSRASLPIELILMEGAPTGLSLDIDLPTLKGSPDTTFRYNATLENNGAEEANVNIGAEAPGGMQVDFKLSGQSVTSVPLAAGESKSVSVEVKPFPELPAGAYEINVLAQAGDEQANTTLTAEVSGQVQLALTAPDGRLSAEATVGRETPMQLVVQNTGSAPARNIALSATPPSGWEVTFEPQTIAEIAAGQTVEVTARLKPAEQAVAGDYVVNFSARPEDGPSESAEFRITALTSTLWGLVGIALIAMAVAVVGVAVMRFGRR